MALLQNIRVFEISVFILKTTLTNLQNKQSKCNYRFRGGYKTAATSKMELFVIIVNGWKPLTIITKSSTLDVATVLDPPEID